MVPNNGAKGASSESGSITDVIGEQSVSRYVLHCFKSLNDAFPAAVDLTEIKGSRHDIELGGKVFGILRDQEFIAGPDEQTVLTLKGYKSIQAASAFDYRITQFLANGEQAVADYDLHEVLLSFLRAHFQDWQSTKR